MRQVTPGRIRRLAEELLDERLGVIEASSMPEVLVDELDYALRPPRHERRVPSYGSFVLATRPVDSWGEGTGLDVAVLRSSERSDDEVRRYADGLTSWAIRTSAGIDALVVFDRSAGSERDLVVLASETGAMVVQRHPNSEVRLVGSFGVARWDGVGWHVEQPVAAWLERSRCQITDVESDVVERLLTFAVHDLGARGVGTTMIYCASDPGGVAFEQRMPPPPPLTIRRPSDLGPLRHVLTQLDGAALFDADGRLVDLGVRIVPSVVSEDGVGPIGGTRHTSARRYSFDDPSAVVIVVSEAGPVTVFRRGEIVGRSEPVAD